MWPSSLARRISQQEKRSSRPPEWASSRKPSRTRVGMFLAAKVRRSRASGAMPIPPPTRIAPGRTQPQSSRGAENELPSGPLTQTPSPGSQLAEAIGAGADALDQEVEADAVGRGGPFRRRRGRGAGRGAGRAAPSGPRWRACRTGRVAARGPRRRAARRGGSRPRRGSRRPCRGGARRGRSSRLAWPSPGRGSPAASGTSESPSILAAIARTAAVAPVIVVTQGMPWRTAAVRIS